MSEGSEFRLGYRPSLDGLRGISVLAVLALHAMLPLSGGGFLGVSVFFTLSGFLITYLLCREMQETGTIRFRAFYLRRVLRLVPAFLLVAAALVAYGFAELDARQRMRIFEQIAAAMFYVTNWMIAFEWWPPLALLAHTWSLSLEEQFYSLWPALVLVALRQRRNPEHLLKWIAAGFVASSLVRAALFASHPSYLRAYYGSISNADTLLVGCAVGVVAAYARLPQDPRTLFFVRVASWIAMTSILLAFMIANVRWPILYYGGFSYIALASATVILSVLAEPEGLLARTLAFPPLVAIGKISYGLYLWHVPVYLITRAELIERAPQYMTVTGIAVTFALATASYLLVETRFLRLKTRVAPRASVGL